MNKIINGIVAVVAVLALVIGSVALVGGNNQPALGGTTSATWTAANLVSNGDLTVADDVTINGGSFVVTTSNTATSTATFGCWQTYATSTATAVKLAATTTATGGTIPLFVFGTCP